LGQQTLLGKEGKNLKINQNVAQKSSANYETFAGGWAPPQTLMNRGAYNVLPDSLFRQMLIAPAPEKVPYA